MATATIGTGSDAVAVGPNGQILTWLPLSEEQPLPTLPLSEPPKGGELAGPVLQQARVLGAAPAALRPYLESSYSGETGVDVKLRSGIELRFGDASQAESEVEGGRRGACRPIDHGARLCRPARTWAPGRRRLWAYASAR